MFVGSLSPPAKKEGGESVGGGDNGLNGPRFRTKGGGRGGKSGKESLDVAAAKKSVG